MLMMMTKKNMAIILINARINTVYVSLLFFSLQFNDEIVKLKYNYRLKINYVYHEDFVYKNFHFFCVDKKNI